MIWDSLFLSILSFGTLVFYVLFIKLDQFHWVLLFKFFARYRAYLSTTELQVKNDLCFLSSNNFKWFIKINNLFWDLFHFSKSSSNFPLLLTFLLMLFDISLLPSLSIKVNHFIHGILKIILRLPCSFFFAIASPVDQVVKENIAIRVLSDSSVQYLLHLILCLNGIIH